MLRHLSAGKNYIRARCCTFPQGSEAPGVFFLSSWGGSGSLLISECVSVSASAWFGARQGPGSSSCVCTQPEGTRAHQPFHAKPTHLNTTPSPGFGEPAQHHKVSWLPPTMLELWCWRSPRPIPSQHHREQGACGCATGGRHRGSSLPAPLSDARPAQALSCGSAAVRAMRLLLTSGCQATDHSWGEGRPLGLLQ